MRGSNELVFELKGVKPDQVPMARMAQYMAEFSSLLGKQSGPLFSGVREGSTCIAASLTQDGGLSAGRRRVFDASRGEGPRDAVSAFEKLTQMAAEDRHPARVIERSGTVVHFPKSASKVKRISVTEFGSITGRIAGIVDDKDGGARVRIRPMNDGALIYGSVSGQLINTLGAYYRKYVRMSGIGEWVKDEGGAWSCTGIAVSEISVVDNISVLEAISRVRELNLIWTDDPFEELDGGISRA
ncbi:hypothetical protein ACXN5S_05805 [Pseudoroseicyclus sp. H15]